MSRTLYLVACCGRKLDHVAPAKDLYQSQLFRASRAYAEARGEWAILSARHYLLWPDKQIRPYDQKLGDGVKSDVTDWAISVRDAIQERPDIRRVVILAGRLYSHPLAELLRSDGLRVELPLEGMSIGKRLQWLGAPVESEPSETYQLDSERYRVEWLPAEKVPYGRSRLFLSSRDGRDIAGSVCLHGGPDSLPEIIELLRKAEEIDHV